MMRLYDWSGSTFLTGVRPWMSGARMSKHQQPRADKDPNHFDFALSYNVVRDIDAASNTRQCSLAANKAALFSKLIGCIGISQMMLTAQGVNSSLAVPDTDP
jgi:hypothetical protein